MKGTITYCGLKGVFLRGSVPLQTLCAPYLWWGAGFDVDSTHVFPQGVLAVITLVGSVAGDKEAKACTECKEDFLSIQCPSPWESVPKVLQ